MSGARQHRNLQAWSEREMRQKIREKLITIGNPPHVAREADNMEAMTAQQLATLNQLLDTCIARRAAEGGRA